MDGLTEFYYDCFQTLNTQRFWTNGYPQALPFSDIAAYANVKLAYATDFFDTETFCDLLITADRCYITEMNKSISEQRKRDQGKTKR